MTTDGKCVVAGIDGSPASVKVLAWTARYATATGSPVRVVLAWHFPAAAGPAPVGVAPATVRSEVEQNKREEISKAVTLAFGEQPAVPVQEKVVYGHPAQALVDEAAEADLLVVGSRGHGALTGMLLGSVSMHCVTHATCPVTVVRTA